MFSEVYNFHSFYLNISIQKPYKNIWIIFLIGITLKVFKMNSTKPIPMKIKPCLFLLLLFI